VNDLGNNKNNNKRDRIKYNILFVPDKVSEGIKNFSIKMDTLLIVILATIFVLIVALVYGIMMTGEYKNANKKIETLNSQIESLSEEKASIETENDELQEKVAILSNTVNEKIQQQEQMEAQIAQAYIPSGFPLKGTATYNEDETELDGNPIAIFHASDGTSVIASASGIVESIDTVSGEYIVTIDHTNGYKSIYRNGTKPKVAEGEEVTSDTEIFRITSGNEQLGYQVTQDGQYVDPLELMEIYG
jgi:murein DD-endopeptidase MepM/ murein hydrolase activator NlpD